MRVIAAICFSALLLWAQVATPVSPADSGAKSSCCGCQCAKRNCCDPRPTAPTPASHLTVLRAVSREDKGMKTPLHTASRPAPAPAPEAVVFPSLPHQSAALPLYRRHCALLI